MNPLTTDQLTIVWEVSDQMDRPHNPYKENTEGWQYSVPPNPRQVRDDLFLKLVQERQANDKRRADARAERRRRRSK